MTEALSPLVGEFVLISPEILVVLESSFSVEKLAGRAVARRLTVGLDGDWLVAIITEAQLLPLKAESLGVGMMLKAAHGCIFVGLGNDAPSWQHH